jgi:hypothetical protein
MSIKISEHRIPLKFASGSGADVTLGQTDGHHEARSCFIGEIRCHGDRKQHVPFS